MNITAGKYKGRKVKSPPAEVVRPTLSQVREAVFSVLYSTIGEFEGKTFLDMFAGSGIMGLEAISRGFQAVEFEKNLKVVSILKENYKSLDVPLELYVGDSLKSAAKIEQKFDVIYIDPPYLSGIYEKCLQVIRRNGLLNTGGTVVLEHTAKIDWKSCNFEQIKQKTYSKKFLTFLHSCEREQS